MFEELARKKDVRSFSISPENFTGEKGMGARATEGTGANAARDLGAGWKVSPSVHIAPGETVTLADYRGEGAIKHIWITDTSDEDRSLIVRFFWDGCEVPAIEAPLGDFFACAAGSEYRQLSSLAVCVNPRKAYNCYFEMPFRTGFRVTLESIANAPTFIYYQIDCEEKKLDGDALYLHAQFRRSDPVRDGVHVILDGVGGCGKYVGTYVHLGVHHNGWWGEGEIKFYLDGDGEHPTVCGTGTEDYFCGSYNFDVGGRYVEFCTPYSGFYKVGATDETYKAVRRFDMYRWHVTDPIYFTSDLRVTLQDLGWRGDGRYLVRRDDISSTAFWYSDRLGEKYPPLPDRDALAIL